MIFSYDFIFNYVFNYLKPCTKNTDLKDKRCTALDSSFFQIYSTCTLIHRSKTIICWLLMEHCSEKYCITQLHKHAQPENDALLNPIWFGRHQ